MLDRIDDRSRELSRTNAELEHEVIENGDGVRQNVTARLERERDANRLKDEFSPRFARTANAARSRSGWARFCCGPPAATRACASVRSKSSNGKTHVLRHTLIEDLLRDLSVSRRQADAQGSDHVDLRESTDAAVEVCTTSAAAKKERSW
jgi:stress-induced morphogen